MIPQVTVNLTDIKTEPLYGKTFYIDFENKCIGRKIDGLESIKQAAELALLTERYEYLIHSWNYGLESQDIIGLPMEVAIVIAETRIKDALLVDERIISVGNFEYTVENGCATGYFVVHTELGDFEMQMEVVH